MENKLKERIEKELNFYLWNILIKSSFSIPKQD